MIDDHVVTTTIKLPLELTSEQEQSIQDRCQLICDITNTAIDLNVNKITNMIKLTYHLYHQIKERYPSASTTDIVQCIRHSASLFKIQASKALRLAKEIQWYKDHDRKISKKLSRHYTAICSAKPHLEKVVSLRLTSQQCRWIISSSIVYISGFSKGYLTPLKFKKYPYALQQLQNVKFGQCSICQHKNKKWYLHVTITRTTKVNLNTHQSVLGVDQGIKNLITTSSGLRINGDTTWKQCEHIVMQRNALQAKGTRSAKRKLRRTCSRYKHYINNVLHCVSKRVVEEAKQQNCQAVALEWLHIPLSLIDNPHLRKIVSKWPYRRLSSYIAYKAQREGIAIIGVPPQHTSDTCSLCLYSDKQNRVEQAVFHCLKCGHTQHADINAAINISRLGYERILEILQHRLQLF